MNINKLIEIGLTSTQINEVITEHNRVLQDGNSVLENEKLAAKKKRDEIMSIEDIAIRQELINSNIELFKGQ